MAERDTHFLGFAKLLWDDIEDMLPDKVVAALFDANDLYDIETRATQLIAQRIYDLFIYDRLHTGTSDLQHAASRYEAELLVEGVPDMTAWPEQDKKPEVQ